ncbi:plasmid partitioning protein RepB [Neorhizobium galegae]|uniref:Plasmid partitioning protein RepB n=1 Tax=Neorhizobium galegae bv. orientalis str. HAMBI 540 TaxID=1028800 RepID=A0A068SX03_NEOGA|nr:plasmid partitioning protein RepB [Neorhizobium galegae]CDN50807.1 Plasmid partitioning protein RepB [Neorhizobium galegae bv. orientalis str. HAMBI 540]
MAGSRKNELRALFAGGLAPSEPARAPETKSMPEAETGPVAAGEGAPPPRSASGAVKAMGLSLGTMTRDADEARALRQALSDGERVVNVHPEKIDSSFIEDRLRLDDRDDEDFAALIDSIRESGQQVPVLLRPHPDKSGRYQTAYGHRRVRAAARLGIEVKAIIRPLSDDELVLAQGKENAERRNLTFIERGLFAKNLASRGFDRKVIGDALAVQKSELSRLMQVVDGIPENFIRIIGPAPKAGRDRWMKLGAMLQSGAAQNAAHDEIHFQRFQSAGSDQRFQFLFDRLLRRIKPEAPKPKELKDSSGKVFARIRRDGRGRRIEFSPDVDAAFIDEAAALLAERYEQFIADRSADKA